MKKSYRFLGSAMIVGALTVAPVAAQQTTSPQGSSSQSSSEQERDKRPQSGGQSGSQGSTDSSQGSATGTQPRSGTQSGTNTGARQAPAASEVPTDRQKVTSTGAQVGVDVPSQGTQTDQRGRTADPQASGTVTRSLPAVERTFLLMAMEGNRAEVELAEMAQEKATTPAVRELAEMIAKNHETANERLKDLARDAGFNPDSVQLTPEHKQLHERLSKLQGNAFETAFVSAMVKDHEKDIKAYEKASTQVQHSALKAYANQTLPLLKKHLEMARNAQNGAPRTQ